MRKSAQTREDTRRRAKTSEDERRRAKTSEDERRRVKTSEGERRRAKSASLGVARRRSASLGVSRRRSAFGVARRRSALGVARRRSALGVAQRSALPGARRACFKRRHAKTSDHSKPIKDTQKHTALFALVPLTSSAYLGVTHLRSASCCVAPRRAVSSSARIGLRCLGDYMSDHLYYVVGGFLWWR